ncbi:MAG: trpF [Firmicutes bacterium]|nr:trpF [Bacillota bacterium]
MVEAAAEIAESVPGIDKVGVFVNQPLAKVKEIVKWCNLKYVQLHGDEDPEYCRAVEVPVIKGFRVDDSLSAALIRSFPVEYLLLDSFVPGQSGGTGVSFNWRRTKSMVGQLTRPVLVAGGLTTENVAEAIHVLKPAGVDVSGGVETNGEKDFEKIRRFIQTVRTATGSESNA